VPQTWSASNGPNPQEQCKITLLMKPNEKHLDSLEKRPELNDPLNEFKNLLCYSIQMGTDYYILRFGLYTVQLWRLKEVDPNASEADKSQKGFQLEGSPYFYKSMEANELVYIRAFKATDYGGGFTFKEDWRIGLKKVIPEVLFMGDTGHIFVEIEHQFDYYKNKTNHPSDNDSRELIKTFEKKWPFNKFAQKKKITYRIVDVDEIFLPISKTPISNNRSSTMDYMGSPTDSDFHEIESACRALHHINGVDQVNLIVYTQDFQLTIIYRVKTDQN
jgi:hypothetical protein